MGFPVEISVERFDKQNAQCALCDKEIVWLNTKKGEKGAWAAHHIDGDADNNVLSNCACVCINDPQNCHLNIAHSGDFKDGELAPKSAFTLNR